MLALDGSMGSANNLLLAEPMPSFKTDSVSATTAISGSTEPADPARATKPSMDSHANAS